MLLQIAFESLPANPKHIKTVDHAYEHTSKD